MSQSQQPQWNPAAIQIFTAARQIAAPQARTAYVDSACAGNPQLRWEVDYLLRWDQAQHAQPIPVATAVAATPETRAASSGSRRGWVIGLSLIAVIFLGFLGVIGYGGYLGVRYVMLDEQCSSTQWQAYEKYQKGDYAGAAPLYDKAVELRRRQYGEKHSIVSEALTDAGSTWHYAREYEKAAARYEESYRINAERLGKDHLTTLESQENWANSLNADQRYVAAIPLYQAIYAAHRNKQGPMHGKTREALLHLSHCQMSMGDVASALEGYKTLLAFGPEGWIEPSQRWEVVTYAASALTELGRDVEAIDLLAKHYEAAKASQRLTNPELSNLIYEYQSLLQRAKRWSELIALYETQLQSTRSSSSSLLSDHLHLLSSLAAAYSEKGEHAQSAKLYLEAFLRLDRATKEQVEEEEIDSDATDYLRLAIAEIHTRGEVAEAEKLLLGLWESRKQKFGPKSPEAFTAQLNIGWAKVEAGQTAEGEAWNRRCIEEASAALGAGHHWIGSALWREAHHYQQPADSARKLAALQKLLALPPVPESEEEFDSWNTPWVRVQCAELELGLGKLDEAIAHLESAISPNPGDAPDEPQYQISSAAPLLITALLQAGKTEQAKEILQRWKQWLEERNKDSLFQRTRNAAFAIAQAQCGDLAGACDSLKTMLAEDGKFDMTPYLLGDEYQIGWARFALQANRLDEVKTALETAIEKAASRQGEYAGATFWLRLTLSRILLAAGKQAEAEQLLRKMETLAARQSISYLHEVRVLLADLLRQQGKDQEAEPLLRDALAHFRQHYASYTSYKDDNRVNFPAADATLSLASCLRRLDKFDEAHALIVELEKTKLTEETTVLDPWEALQSFQLCDCAIQLYEKSGKPDHLEAWKSKQERLAKRYPGVAALASPLK